MKSCCNLGFLTCEKSLNLFYRKVFLLFVTIQRIIRQGRSVTLRLSIPFKFNNFFSTQHNPQKKTIIIYVYITLNFIHLMKTSFFFSRFSVNENKNERKNFFPLFFSTCRPSLSRTHSARTKIIKNIVTLNKHFFLKLDLFKSSFSKGKNFFCVHYRCAF